MRDFKSGFWLKQSGYQSFSPTQVNRQWQLDSPQMLNSLSSADRELGRLDMFSQHVPDIDLFIQMHVAKEATESSRIEDTCTEIDEAILPEEEIAVERRDDWREVQNYIHAMDESCASLKSLPFSVRLLKQAHATLLSGVRGEQKLPGEFRKSQNWIGGSNPGNARFVPPFHEEVSELMSDLERFAHNDHVHVPPLIRAAIMHYQFETIHPFLDGNGRIGRLMVPLYLISIGILKAPVLYLSDYLERNRVEYYNRLTAVREKSDMNGWVHFFLDGISETASQGINTFDKVLKLKQSCEKEISTWKRHATQSATLLNELYKHPYTNAQMVAAAANVSMPTAYKIIEVFTKAGFLKELTKGQRNRTYLFEPYIQIFR